jgi:hypothetical protein
VARAALSALIAIETGAKAFVANLSRRDRLVDFIATEIRICSSRQWSGIAVNISGRTKPVVARIDTEGCRLKV